MIDAEAAVLIIFGFWAFIIAWGTCIQAVSDRKRHRR